MYNFNNLLVRADSAQTGNTNGLIAQLFNKAFDNRQGDISIKQSQPDFAQRGVNIGFRQRTTLGKPVKYRL